MYRPLRTTVLLALAVSMVGCASPGTVTGDPVGGPGLGGTYGNPNAPRTNADQTTTAQEPLSSPPQVTSDVPQDIWWIHGPGTMSFEEINSPASLRDLAASSSAVVVGRPVSVTEGRAYPEMASTFSSTVITIAVSQWAGSFRPQDLTLELPRSVIYSLNDVESAISDSDFLLFLAATPEGLARYGGTAVCPSPGLCVIGQTDKGLYTPLAVDKLYGMSDARDYASIEEAFKKLGPLAS